MVFSKRGEVQGDRASTILSYQISPILKQSKGKAVPAVHLLHWPDAMDSPSRAG